MTDELIAQMLERFGAYGVTKEMIEKRIQRHMSALTPAMAMSLKKIYNSLRDGMSAPAEWFDVGDDPAANVATPAADSRTSAVKQRMRSRKGTDESTSKQKPAPAGEAATVRSNAGGPAVTFAEVADALNAATGSDALNAAADLIRCVPDEAQRRELTQIYDTRLAEFDQRDA